jgi:hypothetical protein
MRIITAIVVLAALAIPAAAGEADDARERIGRAYGLEGWDRVEELRYTFNAKSGERETRRSWVWRVKERTVTFRDEVAGTEPFTYSLDDVGDDPPEQLKNIDHRFINDQYWLLFALHVAWDTDASVTVADDQPLPIGDGRATKVTVQYPEQGGYTPGDAYDVYVDANDRVLQWVFRKGGRPEPSLAAAWDDQRQFGPLLIPTRFRWSDGSVKIWFSGVEVKAGGQ